MDDRERRFAALITWVHGMDHFLKRVFPPLVPVWAITFGFPLWQLGLLLGARRIGSAISPAPAGVLSDRYDRRVLMTVGIGLIGLALGAFAAVPLLGGVPGIRVGGLAFEGAFVVMLGAILVLGIGSGVVHPAGYPLITANIRGENKGTVLGMWGSASKFGDGLAPAAVGVLLLLLSWDHIMAVFAVLGVGTATVFFVAARSFDVHPAAPKGGPDDGDTEPIDVWHADRRLYVYPMLAVLAYFALFVMTSNGLFSFIPAFITGEYGYSFTVHGVAVTPESTASFYYSMVLVVAGTTQLGVGWFVDRYGPGTVLLALIGAATLVLLSLSTLSLSPLGLFVVLALLGATLWSVNPARDALISQITPPEREGRTFGYLWTIASLFAAAAPVVTGYIGDVAGLREAFLVLVGILALSAVPVALLFSDRVYLDSRRRRSGTDAD